MPALQTILRLRRHRRGIALLVVLLISILLIVIVYSFQENVGREAAIARNNLDGTRAYFIAHMGLIKGQAILRLDEQADYDSLNEPWSQPVNWEGENFGAPDGEERPTEPKIAIADEERKFNLLLTVRGDEHTRKMARELLVRLINICRRDDERLQLDTSVPVSDLKSGDREYAADVLVENLVRYLEERPQEDSDDLEMGKGDSSQSMHKQTPFPMLTVGELLQIEGWNRDLLYGPPRPLTADQAAAKGDNEDGPPKSFYDLTEEEKFEERRKMYEKMDDFSTDPNPIGLLPFVTLYSTGQININTCSRELLLALDEEITWEAAEEIITARETARKEIKEAEENNTTTPPEPDPEADKEDKTSFRTADLAKYEDFVKRVKGDKFAEEPTITGFTSEIFTRVKPWLSVKSKTFTVLASCTFGKLTRSLFGLYRRTGSNAAAPAPNPNPAPPPSQPTPPPDPKALPKEPGIKLMVLMVDYAGN